MTKKKHEELVEEIAEELGGICDPMASYHPSKEEYLRDAARTFITLILAAFHDGRLDKEFGVVGRLEENPTAKHQIVSGCGDCLKVSAGLKQWIINQFNEGARTFVALRRIGKEEQA